MGSPKYLSYVHNNYIGQYEDQFEPVLEPKQWPFQGNYQIQNSRISDSSNHPGYTDSEYHLRSVSPSISFSSTEFGEEGHRPKQKKEGSTRLLAGSLAMNLKLLDLAIS